MEAAELEALAGYRAFQESLGAEIGRIARESGATCNAECTGCCYQLVQLRFVDALALVAALRAKGLVTPEMESRVLAAAQKTRAPGTGWADPAGYFESRRPCVFLSPGSKPTTCTVYEERPIVCRLHYSISPPEWCHPDDGKRHIPVTLKPMDLHLEQETKKSPKTVRALVNAEAAIVEGALGIPNRYRGVHAPFAYAVAAAISFLREGPSCLPRWFLGRDLTAVPRSL